MSRIRSKDTKPEIIVRKFLFRQGFRYRLHGRMLPGKPDLVFQKRKTVIFVHGCFWHGHEGCRYSVVPKTRREWWLAKINRNRELDTINVRKLEGMGWKVIIVFECELKPVIQSITLNDLLNQLEAGPMR